MVRSNCSRNRSNSRAPLSPAVSGRTVGRGDHSALAPAILTIATRSTRRPPPVASDTSQLPRFTSRSRLSTGTPVARSNHRHLAGGHHLAPAVTMQVHRSVDHQHGADAIGARRDYTHVRRHVADGQRHRCRIERVKYGPKLRRSVVACGNLGFPTFIKGRAKAAALHDVDCGRALTSLPLFPSRQLMDIERFLGDRRSGPPPVAG